MVTNASSTDVSVIVCCHNSAERLPSLLRSFKNLQLGRLAIEWVFVDNASSDETQSMIEAASAELSGKTIILREERLGHMYARVAGLAASSGRLIVFFDDDNHPEPEYLIGAWALFEKEPKLVAAGGKCYPGGARMPDWVRPIQGFLALREFDEEEFFRFGDALGAKHPWGAGLVLLGEAAREAPKRIAEEDLYSFGRMGGRLGSCDDTLICYLAASPDGLLAYSPTLKLTHVMPESRYEPEYLLQLVLGISMSGVRFAEYVASHEGSQHRPARGVALGRLRLFLATLRDLLQAATFLDKAAIMRLEVRVVQLLALAQQNSGQFVKPPASILRSDRKVDA